MSQETSKLDQIQENIHPWKVTFIDKDLEEQYMKWNWDKAYNRYRLLFIFGFLMVLSDPTMYQKDPLAAFVEALATILILSFPILLRKSSFFQQHHDQLDDDAKLRLQKNPLRLLDSKQPAIQALINQAPVMADNLTEAAASHFKRCCHLLDQLQIPYPHNPR